MLYFPLRIFALTGSKSTNKYYATSLAPKSTPLLARADDLLDIAKKTGVPRLKPNRDRI